MGVLTVKADRREELLRLMKVVQETTLRDEKGSIQFVYGEDKATENKFYIFDQYVNEEAFTEHTKMPAYQSFVEFAKTDPFTEGGAPVGGFYNTLEVVDKAGPFTLNISISVKEERRDEFHTLIRNNQKQSLAVEEGCIKFVFGEDKEKTNTFHFHEEYVNEDAFNKHFETPHVKIWIDFTQTDPFPKGSEPIVGQYAGAHETGKKEPIRAGLALNVVFTLKADRREDFLRMIKVVQETTLRDDKGSIQFVYGEDKATENKFYLFEQYVNEEAFAEHGKMPAFNTWVEFTKTDPFTEGGGPVANIYNILEVVDKAGPCAMHASFSVKEERRDEFLTLIRNNQKQSLAVKRPLQEGALEEGCIRFVVGEDKDKTNTFHLHEEYSSEDAFHKHFETPHVKAWTDFPQTDPFTKGGEPIFGVYACAHG